MTAKQPWHRPGEKIGGGFFVFRRGKKTGRIARGATALPFEHPTIESAQAEAVRLSHLSPGETYAVLHQVFSSFHHESDVSAPEGDEVSAC